jgi:hypothetical protein
MLSDLVSMAPVAPYCRYFPLSCLAATSLARVHPSVVHPLLPPLSIG